jgi:predicted SAM-dependent methyltransferase
VAVAGGGMTELLRLNLACGGSRWPGFVNSDINGEPGVDHVDLEEFPYPYEDGSADVIMLSHALFMTLHGKPCHPDLAPIFEECHRILAKGGWLRIDDKPLRCFQDGEHVDPGEVNEEASRGYPDSLRITRDDLKAVLKKAGFRRIHDVTSDTHIPAEGEIREAILANRLGHHSFTVEAQK